MRMNYKLIPTDYYEELCNKGIKTAKKAEAFLSYCINGELGHYHAVRYYSKRWDVSTSTAHGWIRDFDHEIDLWASHWQLKNNQHYGSVKKLTEQTEHLHPNKPNSSMNEYSGVLCDTPEQTEHLHPNKALNINNNNISNESLFEDLFFIYAQNYNFPGKKSEAYEAYLKVKETATYDQFKKAIFFYLHDPKHNFNQQAKLYNAKNFFKEGAYYSYIPKHINIKVDGTWISGIYDTDTYIFTASNGEHSRLPDDVFKKKFSNGELEFIREVAA